YEPRPNDYVRYDFHAIDADVLGGIYEQYLEELHSGAVGKRRMQGIFYTPPMVTHYIASTAIRHRIADLGGAAAAHDLSVLDPACGSGSFLIAALDVLHAELYPG